MHHPDRDGGYTRDSKLGCPMCAGARAREDSSCCVDYSRERASLQRQESPTGTAPGFTTPSLAVIVARELARNDDGPRGGGALHLACPRARWGWVPGASESREMTIAASGNELVTRIARTFINEPW
jgi:hypothetical protein